MDFTAREIFIAILGSSGVIGGLLSAFVFVTGRLDARRQRLTDAAKTKLEEAVEIRRLNHEANGKGADFLVENLWRLLAEKEKEIEEVKAELEECDRKYLFSRPTVAKVSVNIRAIRKEIESLNLMILNEEETNVFMRRFQTVKVLLDDTEGLLP